ncbi:hypothetical protein B5P45_04550 [Phyllobacterium zundukense]|uniref:Uncharacterized protein n=1 Tax=Phyllobacterium zundukense TaxID=1867719 RepID=A0A2N9W249_9HYPH|nr:hypothetical protein BLM14_05880 [Phyllobacterium zundukense]PIO45817.1 hypothetical protein B5P45_04550 [Phyllobacterium zundukense]
MMALILVWTGFAPRLSTSRSELAAAVWLDCLDIRPRAWVQRIMAAHFLGPPLFGPRIREPAATLCILQPTDDD